MLSQIKITEQQYRDYQLIPQENIFVHFNSNFLLTGEVLLYKIYCINNKTGLYSDLSKVAYVELIDENLKSVYKDKVRIPKGIGQGDFPISSDLKSGNYKLIANTNWMKNINSFYQEDIYIINPYSNKLPKSDKNFDSLKDVTAKSTLRLNKATYKKREKVILDFKETEKLNGNSFPTNFDKPHDLKLAKRVNLSTNITYQTGRPITYPTGKYSYQNNEYILYSDRNKFRIPDYYRVDFGINIEGNHKTKKIAHSFWNISIYNLFGKNNPYSIFFVTEGGKVKSYQSSIFSRPVPSISYNLKF